MKEQMTFDLYTGDVDREGIYRILLFLGIDSFTLIPICGFDKGSPEDSLIIRIIGNAGLLETVKKIGWNIKSANRQATVLLSSYLCSTEIL